MIAHHARARRPRRRHGRPREEALVRRSSRRSSSPAGSAARASRRAHGPNKGGTVDVDGVKFTLTNAFHSLEHRRRRLHGRAVRHRRSTLEDGTKVYFAGDTCVFGDMQLIGRIYSPDVAVLPIGGHFTMDPKEAAVALELLGTKRCVPCHFGTFPLLAGTPQRAQAAGAGRRRGRDRAGRVRSSCDDAPSSRRTRSWRATSSGPVGRRDAVEVPRRRLGRAVGRGRASAPSRRSRTRTRSTGRTGSRCCARGFGARRSSKRLTEADEGREQRQLGVVDARGGAATYTGGECHDWAGGRTGDGYAAQGNILVSAETVDALAETFEALAGTTARRAAARLPRRGAGGRRRQARPAVRSAARRREGRAATRSCPTSSSTCASTTTSVRSRSCGASTDCTTRCSGARRRTSGSTSTTRSARSSTERLARSSATRASSSRRSPTGPGRRTTRCASRESSGSIPSCSRR